MKTNPAKMDEGANKVNFLDCTLRDGGYYNSWDFKKELVSNYFESMKSAKVDIIEVGLRTLTNKGFNGPYAFSTDSFIESLGIPETLILAVMVNGSTFAKSNNNIEHLIDKLFPKGERDSPISVVRIACRFKELEAGVRAAQELKKKNFRVAINLMQAADLSSSQVVEFAKKTNINAIEAIYLADSTGSMTPRDVRTKIKLLREESIKDIGIHTHDNIGLALANTIEAKKAGATWLDSTVTGMGRGPGNAKTEELLVETNADMERNANIIPLLSSIEEHFNPLQEKHKWGKNIYYFISGKKGIHPSFVQTMLSDSRYDGTDIMNAINNLSSKDSKDFNTSKLINANNFYSETATGEWAPATIMKDHEVLILAPGPSTKLHEDQIKAYILKRSPIVISLNLKSPIPDKLIHFKSICHPIRFLTAAPNLGRQEATIIAPIKASERNLKKSKLETNFLHFGMQVIEGKFEFNETTCISPSPLVLAYTLGIAVSGQAHSISIVGIDGYPPGDARNNEVDKILKIFNRHKNEIPLTSLTPTAHSDIECRSIYGSI